MAEIVAILAPVIACRSCGGEMHYLGKLPAIGLHTAVQIFKCQSCMKIRSIAPEAAMPKEATAR